MFCCLINRFDSGNQHRVGLEIMQKHFYRLENSILLVSISYQGHLSPRILNIYGLLKQRFIYWDVAIKNDTPYLALKWKIWGVFREFFKENGLDVLRAHCMSLTLLFEPFMSITPLLQRTPELSFSETIRDLSALDTRITFLDSIYRLIWRKESYVHLFTSLPCIICFIYSTNNIYLQI